MSMLPPTLAQRLDQSQPDSVRAAALSELSREGQFLVDAFFRRRDIIDGDERADLCSMVWETVVRKVKLGEFHAGAQPAMAYVYGCCGKVFLHYVDRDRRRNGKLISLDPDMDSEEALDCEELLDVEIGFDEQRRYDTLLSRLSTDECAVAALWWKDVCSVPEIAQRLNRNPKTVRKYLRTIALQLRAIMNEETSDAIRP